MFDSQFLIDKHVDQSQESTQVSLEIDFDKCSKGKKKRIRYEHLLKDDYIFVGKEQDENFYLKVKSDFIKQTKKQCLRYFDQWSVTNWAAIETENSIVGGGVTFPKRKDSETQRKINLLLGTKIGENTIESERKAKFFSLEFIPFPDSVKHDKVQKRNKQLVRPKCQNYSQANHFTKECENKLQRISDVCLLCRSPSHKRSLCPFEKCLRCNRLGHRTFKCKLLRSPQKCLNCYTSGHSSIDCLKKPPEMSIEIQATHTCYFCGKKGHFICPFNNYKFCQVGNHDNEAIYVSSSEDSFSSEKDCLDQLNKISPQKDVNKTLCSESFTCLKSRSKKRNKYDWLLIHQSRPVLEIGSKLMRDKNFLCDSSFSDESEDKFSSLESCLKIPPFHSDQDACFTSDSRQCKSNWNSD